MKAKLRKVLKPNLFPSVSPGRIPPLGGAARTYWPGKFHGKLLSRSTFPANSKSVSFPEKLDFALKLVICKCDDWLLPRATLFQGIKWRAFFVPGKMKNSPTFRGIFWPFFGSNCFALLFTNFSPFPCKTNKTVALGQGILCSKINKRLAGRRKTRHIIPILLIDYATCSRALLLHVTPNSSLINRLRMAMIYFLPSQIIAHIYVRFCQSFGRVLLSTTCYVILGIFSSGKRSRNQWPKFAHKRFPHCATYVVK